MIERLLSTALSRIVWFFIAFLAVIILLFSAASASPQVYYKLSNDGPLPIGGDVYDFQVSPDSQYTVYRAGQDVAERLDLYSVPTDGSADPKEISALPDSRRYITAFEISPDNAFVIYNADQDQEGLHELYSTPIDGSSPPIKLSGEMVENGGLDDFWASFRISQDGSMVIYKAQQDTFDVEELYVAPSDGSEPAQKLNGELPEGGETYAFDITSDSKYLVYTADQETADVAELYQVPLDRSETPKKLSGDLVDGGYVYDFKLSPDGKSVIFLADKETNDVTELYVVPVDGSSMPLKLNGPLVPNGNVGVGGSVYFSPDSLRVIYVADQDTNDVDELFSVPITGGMPVKLNGMLPMGGDVKWTDDPQISPDSSRVVYIADQDTNDVYELYSVPISGGMPVKLNGALAGISVNDFEINQGSSLVIYTAQQDSPTANELFSVPLAGGSKTKLNHLLGLGEQVNNFEISSDSSKVVYMAQKEMAKGHEIYRVPPTGGPVTKVNDTLVAGGEVDRYTISPDSLNVVYIADQDLTNVKELYKAPLPAPGPVTKLNLPLASSADIWDYRITSDSKYALFVANQDRPFGNDLYRAKLDGSDDPLLLSKGLIGNYTIYQMEPTNDSVYAVFLKQTTGEPDMIYSVAVDGTNMPLQLSVTALPNGDIHFFRLSEDSQWVVYRGRISTAGIHEIYSVPIEGSGVQTRLNGILVPDGEVQDFIISPDSKWVVYTADQETKDVYEIYSVPIGGGMAQKLNGTLPPNGSVNPSTFDISADGKWVAYIADQDTLNVNELYLVPVDRSAEPKKVSGDLVQNGNVSWFEFSPDGKYLVYYADQDNANKYEIYGVSVTNPTNPTKLNAPLGNKNVINFEFTPNSNYLIYIAGQTFAQSLVEDHNNWTNRPQTGEIDVYSINLSSEQRVALDQPFGPDEFFGYFDFSPDSNYLVYSIFSGFQPAGLNDDEKIILYSVPSDFSEKPAQLNDPNQEGYLISQSFISSNSKNVIYSIFDTPGTFEFYNAFIDGQGTPGKTTIPMVYKKGQTKNFQLSPDDSRIVYKADQDIEAVEELYGSTLPQPIPPDPNATPTPTRTATPVPGAEFKVFMPAARR